VSRFSSLNQLQHLVLRQDRRSELHSFSGDPHEEVRLSSSFFESTESESVDLYDELMEMTGWKVTDNINTIDQ
jgi:hypothetical protein